MKKEIDTSIRVSKKTVKDLTRIRDYYGISSIENLLKIWIKKFDSFDIEVISKGDKK